ncbi:MAG TPA: hypothetical protein VEK85_04200 [Gemmatimonadales bacterium]|nr:hypothetical protein [Gemmatimonadales bacterium]
MRHLVASPLVRPVTLRALRARVRADNLHRELGYGPPTGRELW